MQSLKTYIINEDSIQKIKRNINAGLIDFEKLLKSFCEYIDSEQLESFVNFIKKNTDKNIIDKIYNDHVVKNDYDFLSIYYTINNDYESDMSMHFIEDMLNCSDIKKHDIENILKYINKVQY